MGGKNTKPGRAEPRHTRAEPRKTRAELDGLYRVARSRAGQHHLRRLEDPPIRSRDEGDKPYDMRIQLLTIGNSGELARCGVCRRMGVRMRRGRRA